MARDPYKYFRVEAREIAGQLGQGLLELERSGGEEIVSRLLRLAHTLKGAARVVRQPEIAEHAHAIEGMLVPFRDFAGKMPSDNVNAILKLVDAINSGIGSLQLPEEQPQAPAPRTDKQASAADGFRVVRAEVTEIDDLLDGLSEAYSQASGLRETAAMADRARRLSDHMTEHLIASTRTASTGMNRFTEMADELRALTGQIQRNIAGTEERLDRELRQVRDLAEQLRLVPAEVSFVAFERAARDSAQVLGKDVVFEATGGDIRLDAHVITVVQGAMLQLVRNAVAHGIESSSERKAAGKPARGRVMICVTRQGRHVVFRCEDDGRGIDVATLRGAARRKSGTADAANEPDANSLIAALLQGGISTSSTVSEVAGRGIGMDIVRDAVTRLGAGFRANTEKGRGTRFELAVPLTVSSIEALVIEGSGITATVPLSAVRHTLRLALHDIHRTSRGEVIVFDGKTISLVSLPQLVHQVAGSRRHASLTAIVVAANAGFAAIAVDRTCGTSNVVFRSLPDLAPATAAIAGASLDADGRPVLMLDPEGVFAAATRGRRSAPESKVLKKPLLVIDDSLTTRMLEQSILESAGYEVDVAVSGEEGLKRAQQRNYGLILVDVEMPGMDGFTFIEHIRRDEGLRGTPAILVTSRNAPEDKQRGHAVGAHDYVVKGEFDQSKLLERIQELLEG